MKSSLFQLSQNDFLKGLVVFVLGSVFATLAQLLNAPGYDLASFDWGLVTKAAISATVIYLSKNLLTTENGKFMGIA